MEQPLVIEVELFNFDDFDEDEIPDRGNNFGRHADLANNFGDQSTIHGDDVDEIMSEGDSEDEFFFGELEFANNDDDDDDEDEKK